MDLAAAAVGQGGYAILGEPGRLPVEATGVMPDLNGDGRSELLLAGSVGAGHAYVAFGQAKGPIDLAEGATRILLAGEYEVSAAPVADFNSDGRPDLLVHDEPGGGSPGPFTSQRYTVVFAPGEAGVISVSAAAGGEGGFQVALVGVPYPSVDNRDVFALPDADGEGPGGIAIVQGVGRGGPSTGTTTTVGGDLPPSAGPRSAEMRGTNGVVPVADLDGDGHPELLLGGFVSVLSPGAPYAVPGDPASYIVFSDGGGETSLACTMISRIAYSTSLVLLDTFN